MDKVVTMARVAGVNLEWLATGKGPMRGTPHQNHELRSIDEKILGYIIDNVMSIRAGRNMPVCGPEISRTICDIYNTATALHLNTDAEIFAAIGYALEQLRRS
jgi:Bacteriophage CI repressor helix-turn-helix domain.